MRAVPLCAMELLSRDDVPISIDHIQIAIIRSLGTVELPMSWLGDLALPRVHEIIKIHRYRYLFACAWRMSDRIQLPFGCDIGHDRPFRIWELFSISTYNLSVRNATEGIDIFKTCGVSFCGVPSRAIRSLKNRRSGNSGLIHVCTVLVWGLIKWIGRARRPPSSLMPI